MKALSYELSYTNIDQVLDDPRLVEIRGDFRHLCDVAECCLESHWADIIIGQGHSSPDEGKPPTSSPSSTNKLTNSQSTHVSNFSLTFRIISTSQSLNSQPYTAFESPHLRYRKSRSWVLGLYHLLVFACVVQLEVLFTYQVHLILLRV